MPNEKGRRGGKTARPTSVGPHDVRDHQEDPANPGIDPQQGYKDEIATANAASARQQGRGRVGPPPPKAETGDESGGTEEMLRKSGPARDAPPLRGTAEE
jgi:hypothetical protein